MIYISPSILSANFANLQADVKRVTDAGANYIHWDIMNGTFVPAFSFGPPVVASMRPWSKLIFDVHLMIDEPEKFVDPFVKAGADIITFHLEACKTPLETIRYIRSKDVRVGLAISPDTPVEELFPYLSEIDMALIMTVYPGKGGQAMIPEMLEKVRTLRRRADSLGIKLDIQVDGGIKAENVHLSIEAGANVIVAGTAIVNAKRPRAVITAMRAAEKEHPYKG